jgi:hypothetical protein
MESRSKISKFAGVMQAWPGIDGSLKELSYALDVLNLDGFVLFTNSMACASATRLSNQFSKSLSAAKPSSMCIPIHHRIKRLTHLAYPTI